MTMRVMTELFGIKFAPFNTPFRRRLQTLTAAVWFVTLAFGGLFSMLLTAYIVLFTTYYWTIILYAGWILYDSDTCETGGRRSKWLRNWSVWHLFRDYFPLKLVKLAEVELDPKRNYLFCLYPHGLLSAGAFGNFATEVTGFDEIFPGIEPTTLTLSSHFHTPFFREYVFGLGTASASAKSINYLLSYPGGGKAAVLIVGGAAESFYCRPGEYKIILKRRRGFVRLALQNGSPLVPVFSFGETDLYSQVNNPEGSFLRWCQNLIKSITGVAPIIPIGRGFFQYTFGIVPNRRPVTTVVGKPMEVPRIFKPTPQQIDEYHAKFTKELLDLFEREKHKYLEDAEKITLVIL